jgi:hypothetical protein
MWWHKISYCISCVTPALIQYSLSHNWIWIDLVQLLFQLLLAVATASGLFDGMVDDAYQQLPFWIGSMPLFFPLLLFQVGAARLFCFSRHPPILQAWICLVFAGVRTEQTMFLYHFVFPPGLGNVWQQVPW